MNLTTTTLVACVKGAAQYSIFTSASFVAAICVILTILACTDGIASNEHAFTLSLLAVSATFGLIYGSVYGGIAAYINRWYGQAVAIVCSLVFCAVCLKLTFLAYLY